MAPNKMAHNKKVPNKMAHNKKAPNKMAHNKKAPNRFAHGDELQKIYVFDLHLVWRIQIMIILG